MKIVGICICVTIIYIQVASALSWDMVANPGTRTMSSMVLDSMNQRVIVFGGMNERLEGGMYFNDIWSLDLNNHTWQELEPSGSIPLARASAAAAYDGVNGRMYMFGGGSYGTYLNDVWMLDLATGAEAWLQISPAGTPPSPRAAATAIIDPVNSRLLIFGGEQNGAYSFYETWALSLDTYTWTLLNPSGTLPPGRFAHAAVYDPVQHRMVVYAGAAWYQPIMDDVWALDLAYGAENWYELQPGGSIPPARCRHFYCLDPSQSRLITGFGYDYVGYYVFYNDAWELDLAGVQWHQLFPGGVSIPGRRGSCATYDPFHHDAVVFGGDQGGAAYLGETYVLDIDSFAVYEESAGSVSHSCPTIDLVSNPSHFPCCMNIFVPSSRSMNLRIFDVSGRLVTTLIKNKRGSGNYIVQWGGQDDKGRKMSSGTFFVQLELDNTCVVKKAVVIE